MSKSNGSDAKPKHNSQRRGRRPKHQKPVEHLDTSRSNNPSWYYENEMLAEQVSQLSFQNLAGFPIRYDSYDFDVPNVVRVHLNPSPGVQTSSMYNTALSQNSAINMSGFRLYSKLAAFTGRTQNYAPQDVSTMILAFGEVISIAEFIRRAFGVANTINPRNRDYPRQVLEFGMAVDSTDMFANLSDYRTRFNTIITIFNSLPIPKNVAYFDKCAAIYEKIFLDANSSMAQTLVPVPYTTWMLDEQSYSGGTVLQTTPVICTQTFGILQSPQNLSVYLNLLETMVTTLLNSSSLNIVYADILNYSAKQGMDFWRLDYLPEGYAVIPEYDINFLLQMHNATLTGMPDETSFVTSPAYVTPFNDVYPDPNGNAVFYNPAFQAIGSANTPRSGSDAVIDMLTDNPNLTDRVECTRYTSIVDGTPYTLQSAAQAYIDCTLPDHYVVSVYFETQSNTLLTHAAAATTIPSNYFPDVATLVANIDWAPRFFEVDSSTGNYTGRYTGDVNFYTVVNEAYLRKLHDFCGLALYTVR